VSVVAAATALLRAHRRWSLVAAYLIITLVMTWPYVNYREFASASYGGDARLIIWTLAWDNRAVLTGLPLFDSNLFFPATESLRYNEHLFGISLFTLPWRVFGASPVLAHNATWWLGLALNGMAAFLFLRRFVRDVVPAFIGSLVFAWSFYVMLHAHGHLHLVWVWPLPLSLVLLMRWFDHPRIHRLVCWMATVVLGALASWYIAVMMAIVNCVMWLILIAGHRPGTGASNPRATWMTRALHLTCAALLMAACVFPFARHYVGLRGTSVEAAAFSADVGSYVVPPDNTVVGRWWTALVDGRPRPIWGESTVFAGWVTLALACLGFLAMLQSAPGGGRRAAVFPVLVLVGFALSVGPTPPWPGRETAAPFAWLSALPGFEGLRAPARFALIAMLGLSGLVAFGVAALGKVLPASRRSFLLALAPMMLFESFVVDFPAGKPQPFEVPPIYRTPEVMAARSLVSLPEYTDAPDWFNGADYLYFSMLHWRPIVNGFGRTQPESHPAFLQRVRRFPADLAALREAHVQYVLLHADRYPDGARSILAAAMTNVDCRLVRRIGSDYLFEVSPHPMERNRER